MLMRKLLAVFGPLLICLLTCTAYMWLDRWMPAGSFFLYVLKGVLLGLGLALALPVAGIAAKNTGLTALLYISAGLLAAILAYQYLETVGAVHWPTLKALITVNAQVVLIESTAAGYLALTAALNRRRRA